jgi:hypothetical protein
MRRIEANQRCALLARSVIAPATIPAGRKHTIHESVAASGPPKHCGIRATNATMRAALTPKGR